jgi:hypothetical protein
VKRVRLRTAGFALALLLLGRTDAWAQAGFYLVPSLSLAEEFDDNVFITSTNKSSDFITRFTPGIELGYRSEPFTLLVRSSVDTEIFARNSALDDVAARKRAALALKYLPNRLLTLGLDTSYIETSTPSGLVGTAGLQFARTKATELFVIPYALYQFTPADSARLQYTFSRDTVAGESLLPGASLVAGGVTTAGGVTDYTHRIDPSFAHQFTTLDTGALHYRASIFETQGARTVLSQAPMAAWVRQLTPLTSFTIRGGPRFIDDGSVQPEVYARLDHQLRFAKVGLEYVRTDGILLGHPGPVETESVTGNVEFEPLRLLTVKVQPTYTRIFDGVLQRTSTLRVYGVAATAEYPITSWLTARLTYKFSYQEQVGPDLFHNLVTLSLDAGYPIRIGQ